MMHHTFIHLSHACVSPFGCDHSLPIGIYCKNCGYRVSRHVSLWLYCNFLLPCCLSIIAMHTVFDLINKIIVIFIVDAYSLLWFHTSCLLTPWSKHVTNISSTIENLACAITITCACAITCCVRWHKILAFLFVPFVLTRTNAAMWNEIIHTLCHTNFLHWSSAWSICNNCHVLLFMTSSYFDKQKIYCIRTPSYGLQCIDTVSCHR